MTGMAANGEARRLDELAAVTREYARFSQSAYGIALVVVGLWIAAAATILRSALEWGTIALAFAPVVHVELLPLARGSYERRGRVIAREPGAAARAAWLMFAIGFALVAAGSLLRHARWASAGGPPRWIALGAAGVALLSFVARVIRRTRGAQDAIMANLVVFVVAGAVVESPNDPPFWVAMLLSSAALFVALGIWQHITFLWLERRLAALREVA
jgi:hypothetical protein